MQVSSPNHLCPVPAGKDNNFLRGGDGGFQESPVGQALRRSVVWCWVSPNPPNRYLQSTESCSLCMRVSRYTTRVKGLDTDELPPWFVAITSTTHVIICEG
ncbi:hypothetical protein RRG08_021421 [Elysia crispata]|uniref:Uncharacterized protein n=1 Tax=Elysia crispata TaxID=231223 RepID=A0AAE1A5V5_9GAST|nr:hypothetical protein RRG08_021421 [Elysia crispata]